MSDTEANIETKISGRDIPFLAALMKLAGEHHRTVDFDAIKYEIGGKHGQRIVTVSFHYPPAVARLMEEWYGG